MIDFTVFPSSSINNSSVILRKYYTEHGCITRTGTTRKKIPCICATQLAGGALLKKLIF